MRTSTVLILTMVVLPWAGCGKTGPVSVDDFGKEASAVVCDKVYQCCQPMELVEHMDYAGGREACGTKSSKSLGFWAAIIEQERDRGRLDYDPEVARRCLDVFAATSCDGHKRNLALDGCDRFVVAKTAPGGGCRASESCQNGACVGATAEQGGHLPGFCRRR